ncbi:hypothetical protein G9A89_018970 [Geosiphon pyriformis]|nr:hypothetical protein G9A89_018970 [Geosiphon pyriformis]
MMAAGKLVNDYGVVVNTNLKHPVNNHMNQAIVMKKIPVGTSKETVRVAVSEFGLIKSIKIQLNAVRVARTDVDKQMWDSKDEFRALLYTLPVGTNAHDLWDFIGSVNEKTCVIDHNPVSYAHACCAIVCFGFESDLVSAMAATPVIKGIGLRWSHFSLALCLVCSFFGHTSLNCVLVKIGSTLRSRKAPLSAQDQVRLVTIYARKSAPISCPLAFSGKTWTSVVGASLMHSSHGANSLFGSDNVGKPLPSVVDDLKKHLVNIESSLISLVGQIGELAKKLDSLVLALSVTFPSQNQGEDIVMEVGSGKTISDETATVTAIVKDSSASSHVAKLENMLEGLAASVLSLSAHFDDGIIWKIATCNVKGMNVPAKQDDIVQWHWDMDNLVSIFTKTKLKDKIFFSSGLNSGYVGAGVAIVMNNSLAKHVCKISEAVKINSLITKAVNEFFFVILGGDFNENGSHRCASFKKCFDLGLVNSLGGSFFVKILTWCNSRGVEKTINFVFIFSNLVNAVVDCSMTDVLEYFDTDHKAVTVSVGLGGLLDVHLSSLCKQVNKDHWKFDVKGADDLKWCEFKAALAANTTVLLDAFDVAQRFLDLDELWDIICKTMIFLADVSFKKKWFKDYDSVFTKVSFRFHKLELLVFKLWAEKSCIKQAVDNRMESFELNKGCTIRNVLEHSFCKVVLDHLIMDNELILEPKLVKSKVNEIIEGWTWKCRVGSDFSDNWSCQYKPLDYVFDGTFSDVMCIIGFDEMLVVVSNLPNEKAAVSFGYAFGALELLLEGVLTNTHLIALIETAHKILFKILSNRISSACSKFDVLRGDNFSVLKGTTTQFPIFAIGSVVEDALEKNQELWLVLQNMHKAYDSVVRIKICDRFIRFFGGIHNSCINRVITDFGLTNEYHVHDGLNQGEVFLPFLWCIFYDLLLCEVKQQESVCGYRLNFHFISKTGWAESHAELTSFFAADAFATTQYILNIVSEFFEFNDISINNNKTMAIFINCQVESPYLTVSGLPISIAKKGKSYCYLSIFLSSESLSKPSLAKAYLDIRFFVNLVIRKAILDKQFAYLVSTILFPIVGYRTQFSYIPLSGLKSKSGFSHNFLSDAIYHPSLYNLKSFEQIQAKSKSASIVSFANLLGILVNSSNNFLANMVCIFFGCNLFLDGFLDSAFCFWGGILMSFVLGEHDYFKYVSSLRHYRVAFVDQLRDKYGTFKVFVCFLGGEVSSSSYKFGVVRVNLLHVDTACLSVYIDRSLSSLRTPSMMAGAAAFFENIALSIGVRVSDLVSSIIAEL